MPSPARTHAFPSVYYSNPTPYPTLYVVQQKEYLETIARHIPLDDLPQESLPCKSGQYDVATGGITWAEAPVTAPPPKAKKLRKSKAANRTQAKPRISPATDPRKDEAVRMYRDELLTYEQVAKKLHMCREYLRKVLRFAKVRVITPAERGTRREANPYQYTHQELVAALIKHGTFAEAALALGIDKAVLWRRLPNLPPGKKGRPIAEVLREAGYGEDGQLGR